MYKKSVYELNNKPLLSLEEFKELGHRRLQLMYNNTLIDMKHTFIDVALILLLLICPIYIQAQSFGATEPQAGFQSTSTMMSSGSAYSSNPTIGSNGYASDPGTYSTRVLRTDGNQSITTPDDDDDDTIVPLGDAVLPLLLFAAAYCTFSALRRRKEA